MDDVYEKLTKTTTKYSKVNLEDDMKKISENVKKNKRKLFKILGRPTLSCEEKKRLDYWDILKDLPIHNTYLELDSTFEVPLEDQLYSHLAEIDLTKIEESKLTVLKSLNITRPNNKYSKKTFWYKKMQCSQEFEEKQMEGIKNTGKTKTSGMSNCDKPSKAKKKSDKKKRADLNNTKTIYLQSVNHNSDQVEREENFGQVGNATPIEKTTDCFVGFEPLRGNKTANESTREAPACIESPIGNKSCGDNFAIGPPVENKTLELLKKLSVFVKSENEQTNKMSIIGPKKKRIVSENVREVSENPEPQLANKASTEVINDTPVGFEPPSGNKSCNETIEIAMEPLLKDKMYIELLQKLSTVLVPPENKPTNKKIREISIVLRPPKESKPDNEKISEVDVKQPQIGNTNFREKKRSINETSSDTKSSHPQKKRDTKNIDLIPEKSYLVYFKVYQANSIYKKGIKNRPKSKFGQGVILSGNNTLADLKDSILCELDYCQSSVPPFKISKDIFPSSMFYINNNFYIDTRHPQNKDYSLVVKNWLRRRNIPEGETFPMQSSYVKDLTVKLNYPYLYQHVCECEHFIVVHMIRLLSRCDSLCSITYPQFFDIGYSKPRKCHICAHNLITRIIVGSRRTTSDIIHVCNKCFKKYFMINNVLIEPHIKYYPYINRSALLQ